MSKKKYIAAVSCLVAGLIGFGSVYVTEMNVKQREETRQQVQQAQSENRAAEEYEAASSVVQPKSQPQEKQNMVKQNAQSAADGTKAAADGANAQAENGMAADDAAKNTGAADDGENLKTAAAGEKEPTAETSKALNSLHFEVGEGLVWPLQGDVLLNYSMDATTYFPTLDQYRYNPAIVISGEVNDTVLLVAKGKIADITTNEVTGCTVTQDLGDGYTAIYGQLKELNFKVGDMVNAGQVLGYLSEPTKYYSVEGSSLYFAMEKDGEPINPMEYFR